MKKIILGWVIFGLGICFILPQIVEAKGFKNRLNSIADYLEEGRYSKVIKKYAKPSDGYLIGTFLGEGKYYPKSIFNSYIRRIDYQILQKRVLTKDEWNEYFTKVKAKKRGIIITQKVPTCNLNPQAVIWQVIKKKNKPVRLKGYLETYVLTMRQFGLY